MFADIQAFPSLVEKSRAFAGKTRGFATIRVKETATIFDQTRAPRARTHKPNRTVVTGFGFSISADWALAGLAQNRRPGNAQGTKTSSG
jgi:hypothetical protein